MAENENPEPGSARAGSFLLVALLLVAPATASRALDGQEVHLHSISPRLQDALRGLESRSLARATVYFPADGDHLAGRVAELFPGALAVAEGELRLRGPEHSTVLVCNSSFTMKEALEGRAPGWAAAVVVSADNLMAVDSGKVAPWPVGRLRATLVHEACHLVLGARRNRDGLPVRLPRWLEEGVAQWVADEVYLGTEDELESALWIDALIPWHEIETGFPTRHRRAQLAYLQAESFVRFLRMRLGATGLRRLLDQFEETPDVYVAFEEATHLSLGDLDSEWKSWLRVQYSPLAMLLRKVPLLSLGALILFLAFLRRRRRDRSLRSGWELTDSEDQDVLERRDRTDGPFPG